MRLGRRLELCVMTVPAYSGDRYGDCSQKPQNANAGSTPINKVQCIQHRLKLFPSWRECVQCAVIRRLVICKDEVLHVSVPFFLVFVSQSLTGLRLKEQGERPQTSQQPEIAPVVTSVAFDPAHRRSDHEARPNVLVFVCLRVDSKMPRYFRRKICISRRTSLLEDTLSRRRKCHLSTRGAELPLLLNEGERQPRPISLIRPLHSDEPDRVRRLRVRIRMRCACLLDTANGR